jgi:uncharacterized protein (TIGR02246 family)
MPSLRHVFAAARFVAALTFPIACASMNASATGLSAAPTEVRTLFESGIDAFNRHALDEFSRQFASDIEMYTPTGWLRGGPAVRARFDSTFRQFPHVRMEIDSLVVRAVAPTTMAVAFRWRVLPMGRGPAFHVVGSGVYVRRDGRWEEVLEHETVTRVDPELQPR